jgi:hypothetical protein
MDEWNGIALSHHLDLEGDDNDGTGNEAPAEKPSDYCSWLMFSKTVKNEHFCR